MESESLNLDSGSVTTNNTTAAVADSSATATTGVTTEEKVDFFESMTAPPEWLTQSYIENILKKRENDPSLKVRNNWKGIEEFYSGALKQPLDGR